MRVSALQQAAPQMIEVHGDEIPRGCCFIT
jgi:hypothetical protein